MACALLAGALVVGSIVPSNATSSRSVAHSARTLGYSAVPPHAASFQADLLSDDMAMDSATAYCMARFKSYDPETGTYFGYDGIERACP